MLSERAENYLKTLDRLPGLPAAALEKALREQGKPCFEPWLAFQEQYAGYVEPLGQDTAIWGILHEHSQWIKPGRVIVDREPHEETWYVTCAEVHPSYEYQLDNRGEFLGEPAASFDVKVERNALLADYFAQGGTRPLPQSDLRNPSILERLLRETQNALVPEPSDQYLEYYRRNGTLLVKDLESNKIVAAWERR